jgi:2-polyprenyl-3-methyl-5-hydroxy-6-metoxy-1,4-benzoquinol methylase
MTFGKDYWDQHWQQRADGAPTAMERNPPNPYLVNATSNLTPGTALDAGCGAGAEAIWLASQGWQVTAADISRDALDKAVHRAAGISNPVNWLETDLTVWTPDTQYDLVTTHYAHPSIPQLVFYQRISTWVAPGGTLLIVGHLHGQHEHPEEATATVADIKVGLDDTRWQIVAAEERARPHGHGRELHDVVVQAIRRP